MSGSPDTSSSRKRETPYFSPQPGEWASPSTLSLPVLQGHNQQAVVEHCLTASAMLGGEIPLGGYAPIGGEDIGREIISKIGRSLAIVMQNHGVFTIGSSPQEATKMAVEVEEIAKITHLAMLRGQPIILTADQVKYMVDLYKYDYGQR